MKVMYLIIPLLLMFSHPSLGADKVLGVYDVKFKLAESEYTDRFSIIAKEADGTYYGANEAGFPIVAYKQGSQICASLLMGYLLGQAWCFPANKNKSPFAFYFASLLSTDEEALAMTLVVKANMQKSRLPPNPPPAAPSIQSKSVTADEERRLHLLKNAIQSKYEGLLALRGAAGSALINNLIGESPNK